MRRVFAQEYHLPFYFVEFHYKSVQWKPKIIVDLMWPFVEMQDFGGIYTKNDFILMD